jgi:hypothetical protein
MRISAGRWAELVEAWEASGRTASVFAAERGITESSLRWWKTELSRRARKQAARRSPGPRRHTSPVALARVVREGETPPPMPERGSGGSIELVVGRARLVIAPGFDARLLRDVVQALSEQP